jgi:hypothetical protein
VPPVQARRLWHQVARLDVVRAAPAEGPTSTYGTVISDKPDDMLTV